MLFFYCNALYNFVIIVQFTKNTKLYTCYEFKRESLWTVFHVNPGGQTIKHHHSHDWPLKGGVEVMIAMQTLNDQQTVYPYMSFCIRPFSLNVYVKLNSL